jgi:hypothetical protein
MITFDRNTHPRYRDTRRVDHVRFDAARLEPARQPKAVAAGFEGQRNPCDAIGNSLTKYP